jgi:methionine salvage enolase-phosphatase E1
LFSRIYNYDISDLKIILEAYAAKEAGLQVAVMLRPGNYPLSATEISDFVTAHTFDEFAV